MRDANFLRGYSFFVPSGASTCNLGCFLENSCQPPKHDGILMYSHGMLLEGQKEQVAGNCCGEDRGSIGGG